MGRKIVRQGAVVIEFAVVLPVFALVFGAIIEISRALLIQHTIDTAAYEGARAAIRPGATAEHAVDVAQELLTTVRLHESAITVEPSQISEDTSFVSVCVEVPVKDNLWLKPVWFNCPSLKSQVTLKCERPPVVTLTGLPALKFKKNADKSKSKL